MHSSHTSNPRSKREPSRARVLVIVGPTASGKSALAVRLAKRLNGEVISTDSRQVYTDLDIGSGKITKREMQGVPHHLLDIVSPKRRFTVAQYQKLGERALQKILAKGKLPIICGGTGLYIDALVRGNLFPAVPPNLLLRARLEKESAESLFSKLRKLDPRRAKTIDRHNKRRLVRALEIIHVTDKPVPPPYSLIRANKRIVDIEVVKIGIRPPDDVLKQNIKERMRGWFRGGLLREVRRLHGRGVSWKRLDDFGLTYRWASRYVRRLISKQEMLRELDRDLRRYAKRQITWWRRDKEIEWAKTPEEAIKIAIGEFK